MLPATTTKQKRQHRLDVHQVADNLAAIRPEPAVGLIFPWNHHRRTLDDAFDAIQKAAGIKLPCNNSNPHECTEACHYYNFHDLRRSLASRWKR